MSQYVGEPKPTPRGPTVPDLRLNGLISKASNAGMFFVVVVVFYNLLFRIPY